jgi:23S rRNA (uridine2552-2'-O)-methyltransferase
MPDTRKRKPDYYYFKAKEEGYKSRASYKLIQMHQKFKLFKRGQIVLDLCGAPGGWAQVAKSYIGPKGRVILLDIQPISDLDDIECYEKDITDEDTSEFVLDLLDENEHVDIVISDCAPKVIGAWHTDQARQIYLAEQALILGIKLKADIVICKVFEGVGFNELRSSGKKSYSKMRVFKPKASRKQSAETYILFKNFIGTDALNDLIESED